MAWSQTERCTSVGKSELGPALMGIAADITEVEAIIEAS